MTPEVPMHPPIDELALFSGGDCGLLDKWRLSRHLSGCAVCRSEVEAFRSAELALKSELAEVPTALHWDRLAAEMTANIHLGLEAGECVSPARIPPVRLDWRAAIVMAGVSIVLIGAWFLNPLPRHDANELVMRARRVELRTTSAGLEVNENGNALVLLHGKGTTQQPAMIVSSPGMLRARYVDADTGQITINNVYSE